MKRKFWIVITLMLCLLLAGCDLWMDGEYHSVTPHRLENAAKEDAPALCRSYTEVRNALVDMVETGTTKGVIYVDGMTKEELDGFMGDAISFATRNHAIGAYAVDQISYEIGTNAATPAVAVDISYAHSRTEILRIKRTTTMDEAIKVITTALDNCNADVVLYVSQYTTTDITQLVEDYVDANPDSCMETPQVTVLTYPERGIERVIEISFTYQTSRETLRSMQETVSPVFTSAELYVRGDAEAWEKYSQLYSFLMERYDYTIETSITPAYSLLRHGVGDSKAFALVYAKMCQRAGLDCQVIPGTKSGEAWYWNAIQVDDVYYHIDLLACNQEGFFQAKTEEGMSGYVWDYSAFVS